MIRHTQSFRQNKQFSPFFFLKNDRIIIHGLLHLNGDSCIGNISENHTNLHPQATILFNIVFQSIIQNFHYFSTLCTFLFV